MNEREQLIHIRARREQIARQLDQLSWSWLFTICACLIGLAVIIEAYIEARASSNDFQLSGLEAFIVLMTTVYIVLSSIGNLIAGGVLERREAELDREEAALNTREEAPWPGGEGNSMRNAPKYRPKAVNRRKYCPPSSNRQKSSNSPKPPTRR